MSRDHRRKLAAARRKRYRERHPERIKNNPRAVRLSMWKRREREAWLLLGRNQPPDEYAAAGLSVQSARELQHPVFVVMLNGRFHYDYGLVPGKEPLPC